MSRGGQARTYFGDQIEQDRQKQIGAVCLLSSLRLVLEERELALDAVPNWPLVDIVEHHEGVKAEDKPLHPVDGRQEHLLEVLCCFGSFWECYCVSL